MRKGRKGIRPHTWRIQGEIPHQQFECWHKMRAQAHYRGEGFELTLEDYQQLWHGKWERKGRGSEDYCLTRIDPDLPWQIGNVECVQRVDYLRRQKEYRKRKRNGTDSKVYSQEHLSGH